MTHSACGKHGVLTRIGIGNFISICDAILYEFLSLMPMVTSSNGLHVAVLALYLKKLTLLYGYNGDINVFLHKF